jgi:hypothetical protein
MSDIHEKTCHMIDVIFDCIKDNYNPLLKAQLKVGVSSIKNNIRNMKVEELIVLLTKINNETENILYSDE